MIKHEIDGKLPIYLKAIVDIVDGEELRHEYGDSDLLWHSHVSFDFD